MNCRLLYLIGELHTGGSERQLYYLLRAMDRDRYKPAVAVWNYSEQHLHVPFIRSLNVPLYWLPQRASRAIKLLAFRALVRRLQPEVIHSWSFYTNFAAYWASRGTEAVPLGSIRSDFSYAVKQCGSLLGKLSARWPTHQISNNASATKGARAFKSFFVPEEISIVFNGIDVNDFHSVPISNDEPVRIVGIGYLMPVKRWERVLVAAQKLKQRKVRFIVQIAGNGPLETELKRQASDLGISECIHFLGHIDDVPGLLARAAFVVHTAEFEGFPNAVTEAMACGRAVVATDAGDVPFLVRHGKTGFVVARDDVSALADYMEKLIDDRDLCRQMGEAGVARIRDEFGLHRMVAETLSVYRASGWRDN